MGWTIGWSGFESRWRLGIRSFDTVQTGSGAHPASYPMGTGSSFPGGKAVGAWSWPLTSIQCRGQRMRGGIPPLPQYVFMAWCLVKHRDNFTFLAFYIIIIIIIIIAVRLSIITISNSNYVYCPSLGPGNLSTGRSFHSHSEHRL
jgi:hypothetical protein